MTWICKKWNGLFQCLQVGQPWKHWRHILQPVCFVKLQMCFFIFFVKIFTYGTYKQSTSFFPRASSVLFTWREFDPLFNISTILIVFMCSYFKTINSLLRQMYIEENWRMRSANGALRYDIWDFLLYFRKGGLLLYRVNSQCSFMVNSNKDAID